MASSNLFPLCVLCFSLISYASGFSTSPFTEKMHQRSRGSALLFNLEESALDKAESAEPLPLTAEDLKILHNLRTRVVTIPILLVDSILPQQELSFVSADEKAYQMLKNTLSSETQEIGVIGFNPHDGSPLNKGVTAPIAQDQIVYGIENGSEMSVGIKLRGKRCFEIISELWLDDTNSFYLAKVEITDNRKETMTEDLEDKAEQFYSMIPDQVNDYVFWMTQKDVMSPDELKDHLKTLGPIPTDWHERAMWVGRLVNPVPALRDGCPDIRPALLSCPSAHDRLAVATVALRASIDKLSNSNER